MPAWELQLLQRIATDEADGNLLQCRSCGEWKGASSFFRNQKSPTGRETKCRACRKLAKAAKAA